MKKEMNEINGSKYRYVRSRIRSLKERTNINVSYDGMRVVARRLNSPYVSHRRYEITPEKTNTDKVLFYLFSDEGTWVEAIITIFKPQGLPDAISMRVPEDWLADIWTEAALPLPRLMRKPTDWVWFAVRDDFSGYDSEGNPQYDKEWYWKFDMIMKEV